MTSMPCLIIAVEAVKSIFLRCEAAGRFLSQ